MRMRSLKDSGAGDEFGGEVSGHQQEEGSEEVVMLQEDDEVFLVGEIEEEEKEDEKKDVEVPKSKRRSTAQRFSRKVVERRPTYDELIEGVPQIAFPDVLDIELEIHWEERFF